MESINTQFNISHSIINNIMFEFGPGKDKKSSKLSRHASKILYSKVLQELIQEYVWNTTDPFWLDDVSRYVKVKWGVEIQKHQWECFWEIRWGFLIKRVKTSLPIWALISKILLNDYLESDLFIIFKKDEYWLT